MRAFFNSWRRMLGCGLLTMACGVIVLWFRSRLTWDYMAFDVGTQQQVFLTRSGSLVWYSFPDEIDDGFIGTISHGAQPEFAEVFGERLKYELAMPFWSVILLLSTCSGCLILWKPRAKSEDVSSLPQSPTPNP